TAGIACREDIRRARPFRDARRIANVDREATRFGSEVTVSEISRGWTRITRIRGSKPGPLLTHFSDPRYPRSSAANWLPHRMLNARVSSRKKSRTASAPERRRAWDPKVARFHLSRGQTRVTPSARPYV